MPYICSTCRAPADSDRNEVKLICGCDHEWVHDAHGGHWANPTGAKPIEAPYYSEAEEWDDWIRGR